MTNSEAFTFNDGTNSSVTFTYPTNTTGTTDTVATLTIIIASVGIVANGNVVVVLLNQKKLRNKIPNIFIINQSILDFVASVILLFKVLTIQDLHSIHSSGLLGTLECSLWNSDLFLWAFFRCSTWNLVSLTFERYLELVHTLWHKMRFKRKWIYIGFVLNIVINLVFNASYLIPTTQVISGECVVLNSWLINGIGIFLIFIEYIGPLIILSYSYGRILWILTRRSDSNLDSNGVHADNFLLAKKNTIKTFLLVAICFIICWTNLQVYMFLFNIGFELEFNSILDKVSILMAFCNCTVNPFVYLLKYRDYQRALRSFCGCMKKRRDEGIVSVTSTNGPSTSITGINR